MPQEGAILALLVEYRRLGCRFYNPVRVLNSLGRLIKGLGGHTEGMLQHALRGAFRAYVQLVAGDDAIVLLNLDFRRLQGTGATRIAT